jgi:hypothetical protein
MRSLQDFPMDRAMITADARLLDRIFDIGDQFVSPVTGLAHNDGDGSIFLYGAEEVSMVPRAFAILQATYAHYGYGTCIELTSYLSETVEDDDGLVDKPMCDRRGIDRVLRALRNYDVTVGAGVPFDVKIWSPAISGADLRSKLRVVATAQRPKAVFGADWHRPTSIGRLVGTVLLAALVTWLSCRSLLPPPRRLGSLPWPRQRAQRRTRDRASRRFRVAPRASIALRFIGWRYLVPGFVLLLASIAIPYATIFVFPSSSNADWAIFLAAVAAGIMCLILGIRRIGRAYAIYTIRDLVGFGLAYYRGVLCAGLAAIPIAALYEFARRQSATDWNLLRVFLIEAMFVAALLAVAVFLLATELLWQVKMMSSFRAARMLSTPAVRWAAAVGFLLLQITAAMVLLVVLMFLGSVVFGTSPGDPGLASLAAAFAIVAMATYAWAKRTRFHIGLAGDKFLFNVLLFVQFFLVFYVYDENEFPLMEFAQPFGLELSAFLMLCAMWLVLAGSIMIRPFHRGWAGLLLQPARG